MKKTILIGLILILSGCHTLTGALIGGGIGGAIGGGRGAAVGAAIGAGIGGEADIVEMKASGVSPYSFGYGYSYRGDILNLDCKSYCASNPYFTTPGQISSCERGCRDLKRRIQYEREREAYDYGRGGY